MPGFHRCRDVASLTTGLVEKMAVTGTRKNLDNLAGEAIPSRNA
jgi:hypothetical protein